MLFTVQSPCDAGLTGVMENLYKRVEFDVVSIHCSVSVGDRGTPPPSCKDLARWHTLISVAL